MHIAAVRQDGWRLPHGPALAALKARAGTGVLALSRRSTSHLLNCWRSLALLAQARRPPPGRASRASGRRRPSSGPNRSAILQR
jgi:hypothetical protein